MLERRKWKMSTLIIRRWKNMYMEYCTCLFRFYYLDLFKSNQFQMGHFLCFFCSMSLHPMFSANHTLLIHFTCYCVWYLSKFWYQSSLRLLYMVQSANMFHWANSPKTTKNSDLIRLNNLFG